MSKWKEYKLKDVAAVVSGFAFKSGNFLPECQSNALPVIKIKNVANGDVNLDGVQYHQYHETLRRFVAQEGDILVAMTGNHPEVATQVVGEASMYKLKERALINQRVAKIEPSPRINKDFLYYFLKNDETHDTLASKSSGSANQANVSKENIESLCVLLPPLDEQMAIAEVLSVLDDKIDLLLRQNKTLEHLAETLFRQWFIDESEEWWKNGTLEDVISIKGGTTPSTAKPEFWNGNIYWTSPRDLSSNDSIFLFDTERKITEKGLNEIGSGLLPLGTVLLSSRAPIGYLAITEIPVAINQGYIAIICDKLVSNYFVFLWCKVNMSEIENAGNGSVFQEISKTSFRTLSFTIPPKDKLADFDETIEPLFQKIKSNAKQIHCLIQFRDMLLPKLMSGEVKVKH